MGLYLVEHRHTAETCPRRSKETVNQLFTHLTPYNAAKLGVQILGDWVNDDEHHLVLILEASDQDAVARFVNPLAAIGSVAIHQGTVCSEVSEQCLAAESKSTTK